MSMPRALVYIVSIITTMTVASTVRGQDYPSKPIRMVTSPLGASNDFVARMITQNLAGSSLGQQMVVDNRPGVIAAETVAKSPPDGYTILLAGISFMIGHLLQEMPYDPVRDFLPITLTTNSPSIVLVHPSLPVKSIRDLIALAKSRPGELNYSAGATGGGAHLSMELFKTMAGVNIVAVRYKGTGPALNAVIAGEVQTIIISPSTAMPHVKAGRARALAVTSAQPSPLVPGLPTVAASGLPGYVVDGVDGVFAPAKTPAAIVNRLNVEIVRVLGRPDVKQKILDAGMDTVGSSPEEFAKKTKSEIALWGKVIQDAGIRAQ